MNVGRGRNVIPTAYASLDVWPCPDVSGEEDYNFLMKKKAVEMYAAGLGFPEIERRTGVTRREVNRYLRKCLLSDGNGSIHGFFALQNGFRTKTYERTKGTDGAPQNNKGGYAGALSMLLREYPDIEEKIVRYFLKGKLEPSSVPVARPTPTQVHKMFLAELRKRGVTQFEWPFNTQKKGIGAIRSFCETLLDTATSMGAQTQFGEDAARRGLIGRGIKPLFLALVPFNFVELDFHKVDARSILSVRNKFGDEFDYPVARWHIGFLVDVYSGAIIGAQISLEKTPSSDDVLEVVDSAFCLGEFKPGDPRCKFLPDGKALLGQLIPELAGQGFSCIKFDNGWSNTAHEVITNVKSTVGCAANFGPVKHWWRRYLIERIFEEVTNSGAQRLISTCGSGVGDTRVNNPVEQAVKYKILISDLLSIIYKCIRNHNLEQSERNQWSSPVDVLSLSFRDGANLTPQPLPAESRDRRKLLQHVQIRYVSGNREKGIRPYFRIDQCRYTNEILANSYHLLGKRIKVRVNRRDIRDVSATVLHTGQDLGPMDIEKNWAGTQCSVRDHKLINRAGRSKRLGSTLLDPVLEFVEMKNEELQALRKAGNGSSSEALCLARVVAGSQAGTLGNKSEDVSAVAHRLADPEQKGSLSPTGLFTIESDSAADGGKSPDPLGLRSVPPLKAVRKR